MTALLIVLAVLLALAATVCAWVWLICLGRGSARAMARPALIAAAVLLLLATVAAGAAFAHGDAGWIASNARYVDRDNVHCCGVADCRREHASKFREAPEGVYVATGAGVEILMPRSLVGQGLYPSIDGDWWMCIRGGVVRCVFKPASGM